MQARVLARLGLRSDHRRSILLLLVVALVLSPAVLHGKLLLASLVDLVPVLLESLLVRGVRVTAVCLELLQSLEHAGRDLLALRQACARILVLLFAAQESQVLIGALVAEDARGAGEARVVRGRQRGALVVGHGPLDSAGLPARTQREARNGRGPHNGSLLYCCV